jgi:hypothetical protein
VFKLRHLPFYGAELKAYDLLSGKAGIGATRLLGPQRVREMLPTVGPCVTANTPMLSAADDAVGTLTGPAGLYTHGSEAAVVASFPRANCELAMSSHIQLISFWLGTAACCSSTLDLLRTASPLWRMLW